MEENLDKLLCAISVIRSHCRNNETCDNCALYNEKNASCKITEIEPYDWDEPEIKKRKEIIF
jgi:hypothetical protein